MNVTIIGRNNKSGLEKDKMILTGLLQENNINADFRNIDHFMPIAADTDLCIHLEVVDERYFGRKNILIPNQEWFMRNWLKDLDRFDAIFCKSFYAYQLFKTYHKNVKHTGFTSIDCYIESDKVVECFHASGKSKAKGTQFLVNAWEGYKRSRIHMVSNHIDLASINNDHISAYSYLPEEEYNYLRNRSLIHIYPSQIEGFGHCINEAKSCAAVVITTNYPPMNELLCNFLIPFEKEYLLPDRLGGLVFIQPSSIREVLDTVFLRDDLHELGIKNRSSFLQNDRLFRQKFMAALDTL